MAAEDAGLAVALVVECYGVLSYAYSGTKRQVVTRIDVTNTGSVGSAGTLVRPRVRVAAQLAEPLITEWIGAAKPLPAVGGPALTWEDALTPMNKPLIAGLTSRPPAELVVEVLAGDTVVAADRRPLTVLQPNQWLHGADYFDALAGFVHVDDKALDALLKSVNALLHARTPFGGSQGYSRDAEHVQQVATAVSDVLRELRIEVCGPAFGTAGATYAIQQPAAILAVKRATALELALMAAACLEKAKLDPVIFLADNHMCAGYAVIPAQAKGSWDAGEQAKIWNKLAPDAVVQHPMALDKLLSLGLVQVLDPQLHLAPADLQAMVVVSKARAAGICCAPLAPAVKAPQFPADPEPNDPPVPRPVPPPVPPPTPEQCVTIAEAMQVEFEIWYQISHWAKQSQKLNPFQRSLAYSMGRLREAGKEPSFKQAKWALVLHKEAYNAGFTPG